ncbi:MAG TPA: phosphoenolpyruvate--protein phosphotransferase [Polyangiaceae bacterium]|nr:phosphoenolpyruvate--protein phosphotransferase [Polyangiaceae bacterium]
MTLQDDPAETNGPAPDQRSSVGGQMLPGCSLSPGYGSGSAYVYHCGVAAIAPRRSVSLGETGEEKRRFTLAVGAAQRELAEVKERVLAEIGEAESEIIGAHLALLTDPTFIARIEGRIESERINAEFALEEEAEAVARDIRASANAYFRERSHDVVDVKNRRLKLLGHGSASVLEHLPPGTVVVARELLPSDTLNLDRAHVVGLVLEGGGPASHAAILARSMGIPAVGSIDNLFTHVADGHGILVDGERGQVLVDPDPAQAAEFARSRGSYDRDLSELVSGEWRECVTLDGHPVTLFANIGRPAEVEQVRRHHLAGVGLFRTEYLFMESPQRPTLDAQRDAYRAVIGRLGGLPTTIRTFDLGGDKRPRFATDILSRSSGGLRGLRFSLRENTMFRAQIQAIMEAAEASDQVAILLPMVTSAEDLANAISIIDEVAKVLRRQRPRVGAMLETPSALFEVDDILSLVDFASLGTNDLTQFMLGADRRTVESLSDDAIFQPALLRALRHVVQCAEAHRKSITVCGEAAGDPLAACLLIGLGLERLSMSPARAARVRAAVRSHQRSVLTKMAARAVEATTRTQVVAIVREALTDQADRLSLRVV